MRTLAIFSLAFSAAVLCARFCGSTAAVLALAAAFLFLFLILLVLRRHIPKAVPLAAAAMAAGFAWTALYTAFTTDAAHMLAGQTRRIAIMTTEYPKSASYGSSVRGILVTEGMPSFGVILYDSTYAAADSEPGQILLCEAGLRVSDSRYGAQYDGYTSSGIYLLATAKGTVSFSKKIDSLRFLPVRARQTILQTANRVFSRQLRPFMKSLMLGDKTELYQDEAMEYALSASGIMHIVAVSGMHIAFVVGFVQLLFGATRHSSLLCLLLLWFFVLMTGCSPSSVRAGIMQSVLLLAPVFRRENDPLTSLSLALLILLIQNPFAVMSVSLQLSFAAAAGMLLFADKLHRRLTQLLGSFGRFRIVQYVIGILSGSLSVMVLSIPVTAVHFHSVQILSPLTNMLVLWAVSLCFAGGYAACLLYLLLPAAGKLISVPVSLLARYILVCAKMTSQVPHMSLYTCSDFAVYWVAGVYVLFILFAFLPLKKNFRFLTPAAISLVSLVLLVRLTALHYNQAEAVFSFISVGQGECISAFSGEKTLIIDCGSIFSADNAGETAGQYLLSRGRKKIDLLILTHLHQDHVNGIPMLLEYIPVEEIAVSSYAEDEDAQLESILQAAEAHGTLVTWLAEDAEASLGSFRVHMMTPLTDGDANDCCVISLISAGKYDLLVTGDAPKSAEQKLVREYALPEIEFLAVGHHGSKTSTSAGLLGCLSRDASAVISVGYNSYGHPSEETLQALQKVLPAENIYRTDLDGTVQFLIADHTGKEE